MAMVKCIGCGFFSLRHVDSLELICADHAYRATELLRYSGGGYPLFEDKPICATAMPEFRQDRGSCTSERECNMYTDWCPALSPKEHLEMKQLLEQQVLNRAMVEAERKWREQQAQAERDWRDTDRKAREAEAERVEGRHRVTRKDAERRFWLGVALAVAGTVLGQWILGYLKLTPTPTININTGEPIVTAPAPK